MMKSDIFFKRPESKTRYFAPIFVCLMTVVILNVLSITKAFSNNLSISNVSYDLPTQTVTFDLKWDNSWRNTAGTPNNWDAAWVFVKFRDCMSTNSLAFTHGLVSTTLADHTFNGTGGGGTSTYEPTLESGASVGIDPAPNNTGVMLRNASDPISGTNNARVTLNITNLPASGSLDLRVFGIEMVYVPQAPFMLGDSSGTTNSFCISTFPSTARLSAVYVSSENALTAYEYNTTTASGNLCPSGTCSIQAGFPKGYNPFFMMKYEITQGQYVDFLNSVSSAVQIAHFPNQTFPASISTRHTIRDTGNAFLPFPFICNYISPATNKGDRACNWLSWADVTAYLDWAALRPLTELEYEKAARGILMNVPNEYSWGNTTYVQATTISGSAEDGTETITTANANVNGNGSSFTGGDVNQGPLRVGIFARSTTTTRPQTGMGYFGSMELTGNVTEYYISAYAGASGGPSSVGVSLGDGYPSNSTANHDVSDWPNPITPSTAPNYYIIRRGGGWQSLIPVSTRSTSYTSATRSNESGGRGGR